ncbi:MAG: NADH-quinone oxidoreductase subunit C [Candidatus Aenigmarchaeota archaeon]|nr:NADH-quinone oxidoreductase subunit C [Candidatus Aenigmarchaeota archaeon]
MKNLKKLGKVYKKEKERIWMSVPRKDLLNVCEKLKYEYGVNRVISISGYDTGKVIEVVYHLELGHGILNVKTEVSKKINLVDSIITVFPSANLFERELAEMLGIIVVGHPNLKKLFLPKEIDHPLRK